MKRIGFLITGVILFALAFSVLFFVGSFLTSEPCTAIARICPDGSPAERVGRECMFDCPLVEGAIRCGDASRLSDACIEIYQPVCGWFDPVQIPCDTYPCIQTYSNSCFACQDSSIYYFTEGECPSV